MGAKPKIVVATKLDALDDPERLSALEEYCRRGKLEFHAISAASGEGLKELLYAVERRLNEIKKTEQDETAPIALSA